MKFRHGIAAFLMIVALGSWVRAAEPNPADYYAVLGVPIDASAKDIKNAYRKLAKMYHPDNGTAVDEAKFIAVSRAYETLSDPQKKAKYDDIYHRLRAQAAKVAKQRAQGGGRSKPATDSGAEPFERYGYHRDTGFSWEKSPGNAGTRDGNRKGNGNGTQASWSPPKHDPSDTSPPAFQARTVIVDYATKELRLGNLEANNFFSDVAKDYRSDVKSAKIWVKQHQMAHEMLKANIKPGYSQNLILYARSLANLPEEKFLEALAKHEQTIQILVDINRALGKPTDPDSDIRGAVNELLMKGRIANSNPEAVSSKALKDQKDRIRVALEFVRRPEAARGMGLSGEIAVDTALELAKSYDLAGLKAIADPNRKGPLPPNAAKCGGFFMRVLSNL